MITLITGGIKSGKSAHALKMAKMYKKRAFIATADPGDNSMKEKIAIHQKERLDLFFDLVEEKINISDVLSRLHHVYDVVILDCLTVWLANLMFVFPEKSEREMRMSVFISMLLSLSNHCLIITNETGMGIIPDHKLARDYGEELGLLNRHVAEISDTVILMVSGIPVSIKQIRK
ncbi:MAG: bifunctional adenosylcobinamide kinase/adenosylcobinamide-phosphate guanylyltransferase [Spirochaetia bacterium]|nr:bifunctional adenosylcobinamide kinase/adenosylcobinamide-phosphate guanylyltransferase [Spirochaetia bacterium]